MRPRSFRDGTSSCVTPEVLLLLLLTKRSEPLCRGVKDECTITSAASRVVVD